MDDEPGEAGNRIQALCVINKIKMRLKTSYYRRN